MQKAIVKRPVSMEKAMEKRQGTPRMFWRIDKGR